MVPLVSIVRIHMNLLRLACISIVLETSETLMATSAPKLNHHGKRLLANQSVDIELFIHGIFHVYYEVWFQLSSCIQIVFQASTSDPDPPKIRASRPIRAT